MQAPFWKKKKTLWVSGQYYNEEKQSKTRQNLLNTNKYKISKYMCGLTKQWKCSLHEKENLTENEIQSRSDNKTRSMT